MKKTRKKKNTKSKTKKNKNIKREKKVKFGSTFRCIPATNENKNNGKLITIDGDIMVVTKELTSFDI